MSFYYFLSILLLLFRSRTFARQLMKSSVWSKENEILMRGAAHFLIYSLKIIRKYSGEEVYEVQELKMRDLSDALEFALKSPHLSHFVDYLQFLIIEQYFCQSLIEESGPFINYLKESSKIKGWKLIEKEIWKRSIIIAKSQQNYKTAVQDSWKLKISSSNTNDVEDWCLIHAQMFQEPIRLNFSSTDIINCNLRFHKRRCEIYEECQVELNIYTKRDCGFEVFEVESIGIFFDNEQVEPITFTCESALASTNTNCVTSTTNDYTYNSGLNLRPGKILRLVKPFTPSKVGKLKISFVTMQLKTPFLALQFDDSAFLHQQNSEKFSEESLEFVRLCQKTLKSSLSLKVEALKPKIQVDFLVNSFALAYTEVPISVTVSNIMEHAVITEFLHCNEKYEINLGPKEVQNLSLRHKTSAIEEPVNIKVR